MKKVFVFACIAVAALSLSSCRENICIRCTPIAGEQEAQELCSRNRDERQKFQSDLIKAGYNCATVEE
jgi:hypothetical protein